MIIEEILVRLYYSIYTMATSFYTMAIHNPQQKLWEKFDDYIDSFQFMKKSYQKWGITPEEAKQHTNNIISIFHRGADRRIAFSMLLVFSVFTGMGVYNIVEKITGFRLWELDGARYTLIGIPITLYLWCYFGRSEKIYNYCEQFDQEPRKKKIKWRIITVIWMIMSYILVKI